MREIKFKKVLQQQEKRRRQALRFRESDATGGKESIAKINKNYRALKSLDDKDIVTLSKVIENSIVFTLSK